MNDYTLTNSDNAMSTFGSLLSILKIDDCELTMDLAFRKELESVLGKKNVTLPQVFIRGNYVL